MKTSVNNYWISPKAISIQLNAMGDADYMQASVAAGAQVLCYVKGVEGLEYDNGHNYRHWPLTILPTYFPTTTRKYVYVAIPRTESAGTEAQVVFPSEEIDIYGINDDGTQVGDEDKYYIWLQGIISAHETVSGATRRRWVQPIETGLLNSDEAYDSGGDQSWWKYDVITDAVEFLKTISYAVFDYIKAAQAEIKNLTVTGTFDAVKGYIDDLRSHNYQSGMLDGSGFRLTNDNGDGSSELEIDNLKVRKKATFMDLEIRKETFVGGNNHYSPAGSIIYRVDYLDVNGERVAYTLMKVPFLLKRFAFLGRMFNYSARRRIQRQLTDEDWRNVHHIRCYLIADDGTTATRNWWQVGDQACCQSFNKATSIEDKRQHLYDAAGQVMEDPATPAPKETAYWWRLITNTGSAELEDGRIYDYFDVPCERWSGYSEEDKRSFCDSDSAIPVAGDMCVCMGNRYNEERMNIVSIYTTGRDNNPPAIKGYRGIHTFSFENAGKVFNISPEEVLFRSKHFRFLNDDGAVLPPVLNRGDWSLGTRYHYYDQVSWEGSMWLCLVLDRYVWQDASGNEYQESQVQDIQYGEGSFNYSAVIGGTTYTGIDHYYKRGKVGETTVYQVRLYTYSEPDKDNVLWLWEVRRGTEIASVEVSYAASKSSVTHPADSSSDWKVVGTGQGQYTTAAAAIAATGIDNAHHTYGVYLWTRTKTFYDDATDPDRDPSVEYTVVRWGIDADGISQINSYYLARLSTDVIDGNSDNFPIPGASGWNQAAANAKWFDSFSACAAANGGVVAMQGWLVWEKTVIKYDAHYDKDGTADTKADVINYKSSRIGQDGQIGQEEYYLLSEYSDFEHAFGGTTYAKVGIRWNNASNPAADNWRLSSTTPNINTQMWSATMPAYDKATHGKKVYLWNFEQRVDGQGTEYATKPVCIGNHARGIKGVLELYALSSSQTPVSADRPIPSDINAKNTWGVIPTTGFEDKQVWGDERYDRAPTEQLPYQWNWTRTLYSSQDENGKDYEDHYHVSAVKGTAGEDGAGTEFVYCRPQSHDANGNPITVTLPNPNILKDKDGVARTADYIKQTDDFIPYEYTDSPVGIDFTHQVEYQCERKSSSVVAAGGFSASHEWGQFTQPKPWSKWGKNGRDGDGVEYVFIRTKTSTAPVIINTADDYTDTNGRTYLDDEFLPKVTGNANIENNGSRYQCTDDPKGTDATWKFEWVVKRTKGAPNAETGVRQWEKYAGTMAQWSNFAESITKKSESYRYATNNTGTRPAASSSDWKTTRPTLQKGYWLYTEITITWSDNSTTVLYTDERNPNDGVAGQDIIVDGSTEMKYYVGDSNTTHPAESSSDWKDLSQVTQTQGKWLWSKATTYYRKASSAAGSHDGGYSVNYNVSYISKDGAAGRAVTGITEYYKATSSSAEMPVPTSDSGWSTNPNVSNWGATDKYLWNYEKVTYSSGTTVERTKPQIVAIWTKDGKGIDSITNYYKVTDTTDAPSKPATPGTGGWSTTPIAPGEGQYLWNYEIISWVNGTPATTETAVQMIGYVGEDGTEITSCEIKYAASNDGVNPPTGDGGITIPDAIKTKTTSLLQSFSSIVSVGQNTQTYTYLTHLVYEASCQQNGTTSPHGLPNLYAKTNFPSLMEYYGTDTSTSHVLNTMAGFMIAMVLTEIRPDLRNALMAAGYNLGPNKSEFIYRYAFSGDQNIARLVGSAIYAAMRGVMRPNMGKMREELHGSLLSIETKNVVNKYDTYANTYFIDIKQYMPSAPGPYLSTYADRSVPGIPYGNHDGRSDYNLQKDLDIYNLVVTQYKNVNEAEPYGHKQDVIQALADKELNVAHQFGDNRSTSLYSWHPTFGQDTIGRRIADNGATAKAAGYFIDIGSNARLPLLRDAYYGRRRPGQSETEGISKAEPDGVLLSYTIDQADGKVAYYYDANGRLVEGEACNRDDYRTYYYSHVTASSYPSGHSGGIWSAALFLMEMLPEKADLIMKAANNYCVSRQICRYHWNSDTIIGRLAGATIAPIIRASADYADLLGDAMVEVPSSITPYIDNGWQDSIAETGITNGMYLWTRRRTFYSDNRTPTVEYSVAYWGTDGSSEPGKAGMWYSYAGEWGGSTNPKVDPNVGVTNTSTVCKYVKYGNNYWMNKLPAGEPNKTTPGSGVAGWEVMTDTFKFFISEAIFSNYAQLGSFCINEDWMLSQFGTIYDSSGVHHDISDDDDYWDYDGTRYDKTNAYQLFDPEHPNEPSGGVNFVPNYAVDGKRGRSYLNKAFLKGELIVANGNNIVTINSNGFEAIWGGEGFKVDASGIQRWDSTRGTWYPMFALRNPVYNNSNWGITLDKGTDFFINGSTNRRDVTLPPSSTMPNGAVITVRGANNNCYCNILPSSGDLMSMQGLTSSISVDGTDRVEFVLYKTLGTPTWYANYFDRDW